MCAAERKFHPVSSAIHAGEFVIHHPATSLGIASLALSICTYIGVAKAESHDTASYQDNIAAAGLVLQSQNLSDEAATWEAKSIGLTKNRRVISLRVSNLALKDTTRAYNLSQEGNSDMAQSVMDTSDATAERNAAHADERNAFIVGGIDAAATAGAVALGLSWGREWSSARQAARRNRRVERYQRPVRRRREQRERRERFWRRAKHLWLW